MTDWSSFRLVGVFLGVALLVGGCQDVQLGSPLRSNSFEMPLGITVHPKGFALVLSSNFDLARRSGSLRVIDLNLLAQRIDNPPSNPDQGFFEHKEVILDEAAISVGNFASAMDLSVTDQGGLAVVTIRETNQLLLVDVKIDDQQGQSTIDLRCWPEGAQSGKDNFPICHGERHVLNLNNIAPFDVLLWDGGAAPSTGLGLTAFVSYLSSNTMTAVDIPSEQEQPLSALYSLDEKFLISDELAYSPHTGLVFASRRSSEKTLFTMQFFDPMLGEDATVYQASIQNGLQNTGSRSMDFLEDGNTATLLVRDPNMLLFIDTSLGSNGMPRNQYLGHVVLDDLPIRVKNHGDLSFVTSTEGDTLYVVDTVTMRLIEIREDICIGPYDMELYQKDGRTWLLIACFEESKIAVLDIDESSDSFLEVLARIGG